MRINNLLKSCCTLGCLIIILIPLAVCYFYYTSTLKDGSEVVPADLTDSKHADEPVFRALFVSDMESDYDNLRLFVEEANDIKPNGVFVLGDITNLGVKADMQEVKKILDLIDTPVHYIPGDRDLWKSSGTTNFKEVFGPNYGLVEVEGFKFLLVDNANEYEGIDQAQYRFIQDKLSTADFLLLHNPIYFNSSLLGLLGKGMGQYSSEVNEQRLSLLDSIQKSSNVKAVFAGDQHSFSVTNDSTRETLKHVVVGSISTKRNLDSPNFVLLKIYADKSFDIEKYYLSLKKE